MLMPMNSAEQTVRAASIPSNAKILCRIRRFLKFTIYVLLSHDTGEWPSLADICCEFLNPGKKAVTSFGASVE